jgi:GNAT superfamily N-acetyltransferase
MARTTIDRPKASLLRFFPRRLFRFDQRSLLNHFLALTGADRRLRFGASLSDSAVEAYVLGLDFDADAIFGVSDDDLKLIGVAHLARGDRCAELGLSVLRPERSRGIGRALLRRGYIHARTWQVRSLYMHCLAVNVAVIRLAREEGMKTVAESDEADAWVRLPPPDFPAYVEEAAAEGISCLDHLLRIQRAAWRGLLVRDNEPMARPRVA